MESSPPKPSDQLWGRISSCRPVFNRPLRPLTAAILLTAATAFAQDVLIRPSTSPTTAITHSPDSYRAHRAALLDAAAWAFETEPLDIDAPDWFRKPQFDFAAPAQTRPDFRARLIEVFSLIFHNESRPVERWSSAAFSPARNSAPPPIPTSRSTASPGATPAAP